MNQSGFTEQDQKEATKMLAFYSEDPEEEQEIFFLVVEQGFKDGRKHHSRSFTVHITATSHNALEQAGSSEEKFNSWLESQDIPTIHYKDGAEEGLSGPIIAESKGGSARQLQQYYDGLLQLFLRSTLRYEISGQLEDLLRQRVFNQVVEILNDVLAEFSPGKEKINLNSRLIDDLGADSLDVVNISMNVEQVFGVETDRLVPSWTIEGASTAGDLVDYIIRILKKPPEE